MRRLEGCHNLTYYKCYAIFIQLTKIPKVHQNPGTYRGQNEHHVPRTVTFKQAVFGLNNKKQKTLSC